MQALRYPFAVGWGGLITLALFYSLWRMISGPADVEALKPVPIPHFGRTRIATPLHVKARNKKPERPPPTVIVDPVRIGTHHPPDVLVPLPEGGVIDPHAIGDGGLPIGADQDAIPFVRVDPTYPPRAVLQGIEGWVKVQFSITPTGMVADLAVIDSAPKGVFEKATVDAVRRWRYSPKIVNGTAVERVGVQTVVTFRLDEK